MRSNAVCRLRSSFDKNLLRMGTRIRIGALNHNGDSRKQYSSSTVRYVSAPQVSLEQLFPISENEEDNPTITKVTLDRPKANAMGKQMISELNHCLDTLEQHDVSSCRCVVLTSSSTKVFSAGADLKERATMTQDETQDFVALLRSTMQRVADLPMPVIASVDGVALGGGLELALAADLRIVGSNAVLGLPETSLAILPGAGGTQRLPRLVGVSKAKELIWTGRRLTALEAFECGLANEVVDEHSSTLDRSLELASEIASNGPIAIRASKEAIQQGANLECIHQALEIEKASYAKVIPTKDRLEGLRAFREGRTPNYSGE